MTTSPRTNFTGKNWSSPTADRRLAPHTGAIGFAALLRSPETFRLLRDARAFALLSYCALRARTNASIEDDLDLGQCLIGSPGTAVELQLTRGQFECARDRLIALHAISSKTSSRGTVVTLSAPRIFDLGITPRSQPQSPLHTQTSKLARWH